MNITEAIIGFSEKEGIEKYEQSEVIQMFVETYMEQIGIPQTFGFTFHVANAKIEELVKDRTLSDLELYWNTSDKDLYFRFVHLKDKPVIKVEPKMAVIMPNNILYHHQIASFDNEITNQITHAFIIFTDEKINNEQESDESKDTNETDD